MLKQLHLMAAVRRAQAQHGADRLTTRAGALQIAHGVRRSCVVV